MSRAHPRIPATFLRAHPAHGLRLVALAASLAAGTGAAQTVPDAGQVLRESQKQVEPKVEPPPAVTKSASSPFAAKGPTVRIHKFIVEGVKRYDDATVQAVLDRFRDVNLDFDGLQRAADAVAELYRRDGWHAAAVLPQQDLKDGVLRIVVVESLLGKVRFSGDPAALPLHASTSVIKRYLDHAAPAGEPLNLEDVARAAAIANELPGAQVGAVLAAGDQGGQTDVVIQVTPRPLLNGSLSVDNGDSRSTGSTKAIASGSLNSPLGFGELYQLSATQSEGKDYARFQFTLPVGAAGWKVGANTSILNYHLVGEAGVAIGSGLPNDARGDASTWGLSASYPVARGAHGNATLMFAADERATRNKTVVGVTSDKRIHAGSATLQMDNTDGLGQGGASSATLTFTAGRADLSRAPGDLEADAETARVQGHYQKLAATLTRLQRMTAEHALWVVVNAQLASRNLDGSEKFALGGPEGVRAYPLLEGSGDTGATLNANWRWQFSADWRADAFYDMGWIERWKTPYPGSGAPNRYNLRGAGVALDWAPNDHARVGVTLAQRIGGNPGALADGHDNDGTHRRLRAWLSVTLAF